jgi:hypothetical protein
MSQLARSLFVSLTMAATVAVTGPTTATAQNNARRRPAAVDNLETRHWTIDGVNRSALVYVPAMAKESPAPVVLSFHGHGGTLNVMPTPGIKRDCRRRLEAWKRTTAACSELLPDQEAGIGPVGEVFA